MIVSGMNVLLITDGDRSGGGGGLDQIDVLVLVLVPRMMYSCSVQQLSSVSFLSASASSGRY